MELLSCRYIVTLGGTKKLKKQALSTSLEAGSFFFVCKFLSKKEAPK